MTPELIEKCRVEIVRIQELAALGVNPHGGDHRSVLKARADSIRGLASKILDMLADKPAAQAPAATLTAAPAPAAKAAPTSYTGPSVTKGVASK